MALLSWRLRGSSRRARVALKAATGTQPTCAPPDAAAPNTERLQVLSGRSNNGL